MKKLLVLVLAAVFWLPGPITLENSTADAKTARSALGSSSTYREAIRRQEQMRRIEREQRRAQERQLRDDARRQQKLQKDNARKMRDTARAQQEQALAKTKKNEAERLAQQTNRARTEQQKKTKQRDKLTLRVLAISRMLVRTRLDSLPKPKLNQNPSFKVAVAKPVKKRPERKSIAALRKENCSFHGDTLVLTETGMVPIRDIRAGEHRVWAMDEFTGETGWKDVLAQYSNQYDETVYISIFDPDSGQTQTIVSNRIHPFFGRVPDELSTPLLAGHSTRPEYVFDGAWIEAADLSSGTLLLSSDDTWDEVVTVSVEKNVLTAFNLTVDEFHTYYVTALSNGPPVWVHNDCFSDRKLLSSLGLKKNEMHIFHRKIKEIIKTQFSREIAKTGVTNPDIGQDRVGNVIFRDPSSKKVVLRTDVPLSSYGELD